MIDIKSHYLGTYGKLLLQNWQSLARLIQLQTQRVSETLRQNNDSPIEMKSSILSDQQIDNAFNGSYQQFYHQHLSAYATICRIETALIISKGDFFKDQYPIDNQTLSVPQKILDKTELSVLKQIKMTLNTLMETHCAEWNKKYSEWSELLLTQLNQNPGLADLEINAFRMNIPISELHDQLIDLKITIPKLSKSPFNFEQYFIIKSTLAIYSALGRLQQTASADHVNVILKTLNASLKLISETEQSLLKHHQEAIDNLIKKLK